MTQNAINNTASILAVDNLTLDGNTLSSTDTNGDIVLAPDGSGTVSVTTAPIVPTGDRADSLGSATNSWDDVYADGLTFDDGTNLLANYVDITAWTPVLEFGGASVGITYDAQVGNYSRIGNLVTVSVYIDLSSKGSSVGTATLTGFPFTTAAVNTQSFAMGRWNKITFSTGRTMAGIQIAASTAVITLVQSGENTTFTGLTDATLDDDTRLNFTGTLMVV